MLGFLSPDAKLYTCEFYEHMKLADKLLEEVYKESSNTPTEKLCKHGWVVIQSGFVGFAGDDLYITPKLTYEQRQWLEEHREEFSYNQTFGLNLCLEYDDLLKEE